MSNISIPFAFGCCKTFQIDLVQIQHASSGL